MKKPNDLVAAQQHKEKNKVHNLVLELVSPYLGSGRNVTGDRYFSNFNTTSVLLTEHNMTYVGTLMKNKREIPPALRQPMDLYITEFVFGGPEKKITLCAYAAKLKNVVFMISSQHRDSNVSNESEKKKPEIILTYNSTKAGVDSVDQMCKLYSTRTKTRRWTVVHFQNWLDIAGVNTFTLFELCNPNWTTKRQDRRRQFLNKLAEELTLPYMTSRLQDKSGLRRSLVEIIQKYVGAVDQPAAAVDVRNPGAEVKRRCGICKAQGKMQRQCNLTRMSCQVCEISVCGKHSEVVGVICENCQ